ncbi:19862_t:CDS:1, partial [Dentiscutata erythropus]
IQIFEMLQRKQKTASRYLWMYYEDYIEEYLMINRHLVHRLVALAFCSNKEYVNHIDNYSIDNKASNLE